MAMPAISVIIPCYNCSDSISSVLQAYDNQAVEEPFEVVAIDDGSTDATYDALASYSPTRFSLQVEHLDPNHGVSAARNRGIPLADAPLVLFAGADMLPARDLVQEHLNAHSRFRDPGMAVLGRVVWGQNLPQNTLMTHIGGAGAQQFSYYYLEHGREYDFRHFYTANVSIKSRLLHSLDRWFDTELFPFEDAELALRLSRQGLRIVYSSVPLMQHYHYHTIWSFSARQYRSGRMAWRLVRRHPGTVTRVIGPLFGSVLSCLNPTKLLLSSTCVSRLERRALHLASFYEWRPHDLLDALYSRLLDYFYLKGLFDGMFKGSRLRRSVQGTHARNHLLALLSWFLKEGGERDIPLPEGCDLAGVDGLP